MSTQPPDSDAPSSKKRLWMLSMSSAGVTAAGVVLCLASAALLAWWMLRPRPVAAPMVAYVLDASPRMSQPAEGAPGQTRLELARAALAEVIRPTDPTLISGLRLFGSGAAPDPCQDTSLRVPFASSNQAALVGELGRLGVGPAPDAPLAEAMVAGIRDLARYDGPRLLVVVTGGVDTCNTDANALVLQEAQRAGVEVNLLVIGVQLSDDAAQSIKALVDQLRGARLVVARDATELRTAVGDIPEAIAGAAQGGTAVAAGPGATPTGEGQLPVTGCQPGQVVDEATGECRAPTEPASPAAPTTRTPTPTPTRTSAQLNTPTPTATRTAPPSLTRTRVLLLATRTPTRTLLPPPTNTPPPPANTSAPPAPTAVPPTNTPPPTTAPTSTSSATATASSTATLTPTPEPPTLTFTPSATPTLTTTPTITLSPTPTATVVYTASVSVSTNFLAPPDEIVITGSSNLGNPQFTLQVIDLATGAEQSETFPIFLPARPPTLGGSSPVSWTMTANSSGDVQFFLSVSGEVPCGPSCVTIETRTALSEIVTVVLR